MKRYFLEIEVDDSIGEFNECPGCLTLFFNDEDDIREEKPVKVVAVRESDIRLDTMRFLVENATNIDMWFPKSEDEHYVGTRAYLSIHRRPGRFYTKVTDGLDQEHSSIENAAECIRKQIENIRRGND